MRSSQLATLGAKLTLLSMMVNGAPVRKTRRGDQRASLMVQGDQGAVCCSVARPMLTRLSVITPSPTQRDPTVLHLDAMRGNDADLTTCHTLYL